MKRPSRSFEIALSAISCAIAAGALTLGSYVDFMLASGYLLAVFCIMVPLAKDFYWGAGLTVLAAFLLSFLFSGLAIFMVLPFVAFFGWHPIVNYFQRRHIKKIPLHALVFVGKAAWFDLAMWLFWAVVFVPVFGVNNATWYPFVEKYFFLVLFIGGTLFFAAYDFLIFLCQRAVNTVVARIGR